MRIIKLVTLIILSFSLFQGCDKTLTDDTDQNNKECEFTGELLSVDPICAFNPKTNTEVAFPVNLKRDGVILTTNDYTFDWSTNLEFHGSAISVSYSQLPLTATVTEKTTDCVGEVTLEKTYWD